MILFAGYTGIRPGELYALRREDIQGQFASISRSFSSCSYEITPPKNGKTRTITMPPVAARARLLAVWGDDVAPLESSTREH